VRYSNGLQTLVLIASGLALPAISAPAAAAAAEGEQHELPNIISVLCQFLPGTALGEFLHRWENMFFSFLAAALIIGFVQIASRNPKLMPGPLQNFLELVVEKLEGFILGVLGPRGRKFVPFLGTLFLYILCMNYFGLVPFLKSPTTNINQTLALAISVFLYVQYTGIKENGIVGYLDHLIGQPRSTIQWILAPLMLFVHGIGEIAKPVTLACRLFGNITAEDVLIFALVGLGVAATGFLHSPVGIPFQIIFYPLLLLFGFIQALVFMVLSTIYFALMLPHEDEAHH
jgi:F-type H+-transporting ATPase subunit a